MPLSSQNASSEPDSAQAEAAQATEMVLPSPELMTTCSARVDLLSAAANPLTPGQTSTNPAVSGDTSSGWAQILPPSHTSRRPETISTTGIPDPGDPLHTVHSTPAGDTERAAGTGATVDPSDEWTAGSYITTGIVAACALTCFGLIAANLITRVATPSYGLSLAGLLVAIFVLYFLVAHLAVLNSKAQRMFKLATICAIGGAVLHYIGNAVLVNWTCLNCLGSPLPEPSQRQIAVDWNNIGHSGLVEGTFAELLQHQIGSWGSIPHLAWCLAAFGLAVSWFGICYFLATTSYIAIKEARHAITSTSTASAATTTD